MIQVLLALTLVLTGFTNPKLDTKTEVKVRGALLYFVCDHEGVEWTQEYPEKKVCPACAPDHDCGRLIRVIPHPDSVYKPEEFLVPNPLDPVSGKPVKPELFSEYDGRKVYFSGSVSQKRFLMDPKKWAVNLPLKAELFGLEVQADPLEHDHHDHDHDHSHGHDDGHKH